MNINKEYWDEFYKHSQVPQEPSTFASYCFDYLKTNYDLYGKKLVDLGCGNGRDTYFFARNGLKTTGIDASLNEQILTNSENGVHFTKGDLANIEFDYDFYYLRFVVHTLKEEDFLIVLKKIEKELKSGQLVFIETRSTNGISNNDKEETCFKASIGEAHFRMLYSFEYLLKLLGNKFTILHAEEKNNVAVYKSDNPYVIRVIFSAI